jgi:hypothetical protein
LGYFFNGKTYALIVTKNGLGDIWATFSQTHLVTLLRGSGSGKNNQVIVRKAVERFRFRSAK